MSDERAKQWDGFRAELTTLIEGNAEPAQWLTVLLDGARLAALSAGHRAAFSVLGAMKLASRDGQNLDEDFCTMPIEKLDAAGMPKVRPQRAPSIEDGAEAFIVDVGKASHYLPRSGRPAIIRRIMHYFADTDHLDGEDAADHGGSLVPWLEKVHAARAFGVAPKPGFDEAIRKECREVGGKKDASGRHPKIYANAVLRGLTGKSGTIVGEWTKDVKMWSRGFDRED
jgi:hypothetical protein